MGLQIAPDTPQLPEFLDIWQQTLNWQPTPEQWQQFQALYGLVLAGNQQLNLTRITEPHPFWEKHIWDSVRGLAFLLSAKISEDCQLPDGNIYDRDRPLRLIDIGTGAGFPGLPAAIVLHPIYPQLEIALLDSTQKKIAFLQDAIASMNLQSILPQAGRAEAIGREPNFFQSYDICCLRAVAKPEICLKYALPFLKPAGLAILYRGRWTVEEEKALEKSAKKSGAKIESVQAFKTPLTNGDRHCVYVRYRSHL
ncbi:16S rRNA (guanine(527)-N(7))-methyltransferase RsmG [Roseofilum sp. BLCC_M143]|uniref:Ribosomal RNA small subunit methyltransferase G n=2 Tax=Roseofilum TaxID=1233426 RepID=A0ABT7BY85_9CYAN|nr:16S rRNA (guanine(527)-N(7))-methyltransferase RsmG [Roseofilum casamattae BLCC-M143]